MADASLRSEYLTSLQVQEDILSSLKLNHPLRLISSFNRPNITYEVAVPA